MSLRADGTLQCDMNASCGVPVTHLDEKGYIYCTSHGRVRRSTHYCRALRPWELRLMQNGGTLLSFAPITLHEHNRRAALLAQPLATFGNCDTSDAGHGHVGPIIRAGDGVACQTCGFSLAVQDADDNEYLLNFGELPISGAA